MYKGKDIVELAQELQRQQEASRDFIADTRSVTMRAEDNALILSDGNKNLGQYPVRVHAHRQIADRLKMPYNYYSRMQAEAPWLLATNVNHWLHTNPEQRLIRTMDGEVRAVLSNGYRCLGNADLANGLFPTIAERNCDVVSCEVTETKLYIKIVAHHLRGEVKKGVVVEAGAIIFNSEVGCGKIGIEEYQVNCVCDNGMVVERRGLKRAHLGKRSTTEDGGVEEYFKDDTRKAIDTAFFMKLRDTLGGMLDEQKFNETLDRMRVAAGVKLETDIKKVVEVTAKRFELTHDEENNVLNHLIAGGDLSVWGLANAVTRTSQDAGNYDRATELEVLGGRVIELAPAIDGIAA